MSEHAAITRFRDAHAARGGAGEIVILPESVHTAALAAAALGCEVGAIANSLLFDAGGTPVLILTSGAHRVDTALTARRVGVEKLKRATPGSSILRFSILPARPPTLRRFDGPWHRLRYLRSKLMYWCWARDDRSQPDVGSAEDRSCHPGGVRCRAPADGFAAGSPVSSVCGRAGVDGGAGSLRDRRGGWPGGGRTT